MSTPTGMEPKDVIRGIELRLDTAKHGLETGLPEGTASLKVGAATWKIPALVTHIGGLEKPWKDLRALRKAIDVIMRARPKDHAGALDFLADLKAALVGVFGRESGELRKFGFKPERRRKPLTPEKNLRRRKRAEKTRELNHTKGPRQKAELRAALEDETLLVTPTSVEVVPPDQATPPPTNGASKT